MNLLVITSNKNRASFRQRIGVYLDFLKDNGINCDVELLPDGIISRTKLFRKASDYDGVFLHKKKLNCIDAFQLRQYSKKIIYNFDDAIMYSDKKPQRDSRAHLVPFRRTVKLSDMVIVGSSYLADHARAYNPNVQILPIGLRVSDYTSDKSLKKSDDKIRLVWIGSKSTLSYLEEIESVIEEIGIRYNNIILRIICDSFFDWQKVKIEKRKWSIQTRGLDLSTSDIGLAPLPDNPFTRGKCSFKVLEYSAAELPVIASPIGTNAEYVKDTITGFLVTDHKQWYDRIVQLIENSDLRKEMGAEGKKYAQQYDVNVIGKRFGELIINCLRGSMQLK